MQDSIINLMDSGINLSSSRFQGQLHRHTQNSQLVQTPMYIKYSAILFVLVPLLALGFMVHLIY